MLPENYKICFPLARMGLRFVWYARPRRAEPFSRESFGERVKSMKLFSSELIERREYWEPRLPRDSRDCGAPKNEAGSLERLRSVLDFT